MLGGDRWLRWVICVLVVTFGLTGCGGGPTPSLEEPTATLTVEATAVEPTTEAPSATVELPTSIPAPTSTPTPTSEPTPCPLPPTLTTAPTVQPNTPSPMPPMDAPYYEDRSGPSTLLASYYNAINRQEYARAWGYWESPPSPSYEAFVQGFADTASVRLAVRPPTWLEGAAGSTYARVPALLTAVHRDGSHHNFVSCFVARRFNVEGPGVEQGWSLYDATVDPAPGDSTDATLLVGACETVPEISYDDRRGAVRLLASYYNAINLREYARAWAYWESPPSPSYEAFVQGFAETESAMLVVRPPTRLEGAAGSVYAPIPALVIATHRDGSRHVFVGCFVARRPNLGPEPVWSLFDATVQSAPGNAPDVRLLDRVCATR